MVLAADREDFIVPPERFKESPLHRGQVVETSSLSNYEKLMLPSFTVLIILILKSKLELASTLALALVLFILCITPSIK